MQITSQAFTNGGKIPDKYTKYGENKIPPIHIEQVPEKARPAFRRFLRDLGYEYADESRNPAYRFFLR